MKRTMASSVAAVKKLSTPTAGTNFCGMMEVNTGGQLYIQTRGSGAPLLCFPGALGTAETDFSNQFDGLCENFQVISFDPRGYGKSRPPVRVFDVDYYHRDANDALAVMDALEIDQFNVLGWSDGANSSILLASAHPSRVKKLAIFGGNSFINEHDIEAYEGTRDVEKTWSKRMKESLIPVYGLPELQNMWNSFCDAMQAIHKQGGDICQEAAKSVKCPVFVLGGEKDPIVPILHPNWFYENINIDDPKRSVELYMYPEGKHNIHMKYAEDFNLKVSEFFQK